MASAQRVMNNDPKDDGDSLIIGVSMFGYRSPAPYSTETGLSIPACQGSDASTNRPTHVERHLF
jgi:hypothetical protein